MKEKILELRRAINVEPVVFLFLFGTYLISLPERNFILTKTCTAGSVLFGNNTFPQEVCESLANGSHLSEQKEVQSTVQKFNSAALILKTIPLIFVIIFLGSWCDKGGRKRILLLCMTGRILATLAVFLSYMLEDLVVEWLWLDIIYELCGGESGLFLAAYATIADETTDETRTIRILIISALWHIGTGLANFVTGYILQYFKFLGVMVVSVACHIAAVAYVVFAMREKKRESEPEMRDIFSFRSFKEGFSVVLREREAGMRGVVVATVVICCLCQFAWGVRFMGINYYFIRAVYEWPEIQENPTYPVTWLAQYYTSVDVPQTLAVFVIVPWLTNWFGLHDAIVSCLGHFSLLVMFVVPAVVPTRNFWYITSVLGIFLPTQTPALRALISKIVGRHEVGKVFAFQSVAMSIGQLGWLVIALIYKATLYSNPATIYLVMTGLMVAVIGITLSIYLFLRDSSRKQQTDPKSANEGDASTDDHELLSDTKLV